MWTCNHCKEVFDDTTKRYSLGNKTYVCFACSYFARRRDPIEDMYVPVAEMVDPDTDVQNPDIPMAEEAMYENFDKCFAGQELCISDHAGEGVIQPSPDTYAHILSELSPKNLACVFTNLYALAPHLVEEAVQLCGSNTNFGNEFKQLKIGFEFQNLVATEALIAKSTNPCGEMAAPKSGGIAWSAPDDRSVEKDRTLSAWSELREHYEKYRDPDSYAVSYPVKDQYAPPPSPVQDLARAMLEYPGKIFYIPSEEQKSKTLHDINMLMYDIANQKLDRYVSRHTPVKILDDGSVIEEREEVFTCMSVQPLQISNDELDLSIPSPPFAWRKGALGLVTVDTSTFNKRTLNKLTAYEWDRLSCELKVLTVQPYEYDPLNHGKMVKRSKEHMDAEIRRLNEAAGYPVE